MGGGCSAWSLDESRTGGASRAQQQEQEPAGGEEGAQRHLEGASRLWLPAQGEAAAPAAPASLWAPSAFPRPPSKTAQRHQPLSHLGSISKFLPHLLSLFLREKKKRKFSQTSLEADAFMILRFSGLKAQWIKDSRGWRFSLRAWGHGQVHGPQPRGQRSPAWPQAACPGPFLPAGRVAGAGHQRQIWAGSGYLLYTQAPRTGPGPGQLRSLIIKEPMLGPGSRWRVLTLKAHPD